MKIFTTAVLSACLLFSVMNTTIAEPGLGITESLSGLPQNIEIGKSYPVALTVAKSDDIPPLLQNFGIILTGDEVGTPSIFPAGFKQVKNTCGHAVRGGMVTLPLHARCQLTGTYSATVVDSNFTPAWEIHYLVNGKPNQYKPATNPFTATITPILIDNTSSTQNVTVFTPKAEKIVTADITIKNNTGQALTGLKAELSGTNENATVTDKCGGGLAVGGKCLVVFTYTMAAEDVDKNPFKANSVKASISYDDQKTSSIFSVNFTQVNNDEHFITLPIEQSTLATPATSFDSVNDGKLPSNVINKIVRSNGVIYAATPQGVVVSEDDGASWTTKTALYNNLKATRVNDISNRGSYLYFATNGGLRYLSSGSSSYSFSSVSSDKDTDSQNLQHIGSAGGTVLASNDIPGQLQISTSISSIKALSQTGITAERNINAISLWQNATDPDNKKVVAYVGTDQGLFVSHSITDDTATFSPVSSGIPTTIITSIATSTDGTVVAVGTQQNNLYVSKDSGASFTKITTVTENVTDIKIVDGYTVPNGTDVTGTPVPAEIYVTTTAGVFSLSAGDAAATNKLSGDFTSIDVADGKYFLGVAADATNPGVSVTPFGASSLVKPTATTAGIAGVPTGAFAVAGSNIYVGTKTGLAISENSGETFLMPAENNQNITALVADSGTVTYGTSAGGLFTGTGTSLKKVTAFPVAGQINDIAIKGTDTYVAAANGLYKRNALTEVTGDQISVSADGTNVVSASSTVIMLSANGGDFTEVTLPPAADIGSINNVRIIGSDLYVATSTGLWKGSISTSPGLTKVTTFSAIAVNNISSLDGTQLYVSTADGLYISDAKGAFPTEDLDQKTISDGLAGNNVLNAEVIGNNIYTGTRAGISMTQKAAV